MPFSRRPRKRRVNPRRSRQGLTFLLKTEMSIPSQSGFITNSAMLSQNMLVIPAKPIGGETGGDPTDCMGEAVISSYIGTYQFDFTRMLGYTLGRNVSTTGGAYSTLAGLFSHIKFGRGYMTITRIDQGCNAVLIAQGQGTGLGSERTLIGGFQTGSSPVPLKIYYIRMSPSEPTWSQFLLSPGAFRMDPRLRCVTLYPNKSVTFSFTARRFLPPSFMAHTIRDFSDGTGTSKEIDGYRRCEIPGRTRRLGWIPMPLASYTNYVNDGTNLTPGLGTGMWRIVSPTIAFMFEVDQMGAYAIPNSGGGEPTPAPVPPVVPIDSSSSDFQVPRVRRSERCTVRVRGLMHSIQTNSDSLGGFSAVGKVYSVYSWNDVVNVGVSPNTAECFNPPRISSIQVGGSSFTTTGPLFRDSENPTEWAHTLVPLDTQMALTGSSEVLPIPNPVGKA